MQTRRLCPAIGTEIVGVDLSNPVSDETFEQIRKVWHDSNGLVVIRDQKLTEEQQIAFSRKFGKLHTLQGHTVTKYLHPDHPEIYRVSNKVVDGKPQGRKGAGTYWHSDQSYEATPAHASVLYAKEIPPVGGDTIFASTQRAYEALSDTFKAFLLPLKAVHSFANASGGGFRNEVVTKEQLDAARPSVHPIIRKHAETGKLGVFVNPGFTAYIDGLDPAESRAVLGYLFELVTKPDYQYRHRWSPNDMVIWDNRCTLHYAVMDYDGKGDRLMHRCTVIGETPLPASV
jgi:taurine dioxygenase